MQSVSNDYVEDTADDITISSKSELTCPAIDSDTGDVCGEKTGLQILDEFRQLYEKRIESIDLNSDNGAQKKMEIMMEWIRDLDAQNTMLVSTVEELEQAACDRVKMLEEKLKQSSSALTNGMTQYAKPSDTVLNDVHKRIKKLEMNEDMLKNKIRNLHNDINGLLKLLRRAWKEKNWRFDDITFFEIKRHDIPISDESIYGQAMGDNKNIGVLTEQSQLLSESEKKYIECQHELQQKVKYLSEILQDREEKIQKLLSKSEESKDNFEKQTEASADFKNDVGCMSLKSPKNDRINTSCASQKVTWCDDMSSDVSGHIKTQKGNLLSIILELKKTSVNEHHVLKKKIEELHDVWYYTTLMEKEAYDKYLTDGHSKADDIITMIEQYRGQVLKDSDQEKPPINGTFYCTDKLMKVIDALSDLCMEKSKEIVELELALQNIHEKNDENYDSSESEAKIQQNPDISRQQFDAMEEFRMCTVEAQAATEDLREEIEIMTCNLNCRHQLFVDLCKSIGKMQDVIGRTKQNISTVINSVKTHMKEKILSNDAMKLKQEILKDIKNEINEARSKLESTMNYREYEFDNYNRSYDKIVYEIESIMNNLEGIIVKENYGVIILDELHDHVDSIEQCLDKMQTDADRVIQENNIAQKFIDDKKIRLDKLEHELDYAHTKMQDTLENIIFINQQNESSNDYSSNTDDTITMSRSDETSQQSTVEIDKLKYSLNSKDKLLQHKDEIIRIQKDSMEMTQGEYKDLRQRLQSKIDSQTAVIHQCMEEKMNLLEQNRLQNQTIKHLQDAVVEAKRNLNRQLPQKSVMDLSIGDSWSPTTPSVFHNGNVHDV